MVNCVLTLCHEKYSHQKQYLKRPMSGFEQDMLLVVIAIVTSHANSCVIYLLSFIFDVGKSNFYFYFDQCYIFSHSVMNES